MSMTIGQALSRASLQLANSSSSARLDAEVLLTYATGKGRAQLVVCADDSLQRETQERYERLIDRRAHGEPIAYITGEREFWSLSLRITPAVLISRPETELVVERVLSHLPKEADSLVADIGTGSGAIAIAIATERPRARVLATDISEDALALAEENAQRHDCANISFGSGPWLNPLGGERFHAIVSNPPYIAENDRHLATGDVRFEPRGALVAGKDGLDAIRIIAAVARNHLYRSGWLVLEHGWDQQQAVRELLTGLGYEEISHFRDIAGQERVTEARYPG